MGEMCELKVGEIRVWGRGGCVPTVVLMNLV